MKTLTQVAVVAALMLLLSSASYATGQTSATTTAPALPAMVLAMDQPAVDSSVSPGAGPETSARPVSRTAPAAHLERTTSNPEITATAARQAMPSGPSVNAAYAPSEKHAESAALSYEELNRRIDALSKEISALRKDLSRLRSQEAGTK